jgi:RNA polymerase sigma factor (sigma-70 family)
VGIVSNSSDEALLLAARRDADAFAEFYRRHARPLSGFLVRRTGDPEAAGDLLAETFAAALSSLDRFDPERGDAAGWLYGIARHQLARRARRGSVEERARRRLRMERLELSDMDLRAIEACDDATVALEGLPIDQRAAIHARVVQEQDYSAIAVETGSTEPAVRQRVSRGLATLRARLAREEQR